MANCYHKIEYLTYLKKCSKLAGLCEERCQRKDHPKEGHEIISCE